MSNPNEQALQTTHPEYQVHAGDWRKCRDFIAGIKALREHDLENWKGNLATVTRIDGKSSREPATSGFEDKVAACYIPPLSNRMTYIEYVLYLFRGHYYNTVALTKAGYLGMIFGKAPEIAMPSGAAPILNDADLAETPLAEYLEEVVDEVLSVGRVGVLVDRPAISGTLTVGEAQRAGLRPYFATYKAEDILDWKSERIGARNATTYWKLRERVRRGGAYDYDYRELKLDASGYHQVLWTRPDKKSDYEPKPIKPSMGPLETGKPLAAIPFYPFSPRGGGADIEAPILLDLIEMAVEHYQSQTEYANARFSTAIPTPCFFGFRDDEAETIVLGGLNGIVASDPEASAEFLEFTGQGLEPLRNAIQDIEARMAKWSRMLTEDKKAAEAADTLRIRASGEKVTLSDISRSASRIASQMLALACVWNNTPGTASVELCTDYSDTSTDSATMTALEKAVVDRKFTQRDYNAYLRTVGIIKADRTDEMIEAELESERNREDEDAGSALEATAGKLKAQDGAV